MTIEKKSLISNGAAAKSSASLLASTKMVNDKVIAGRAVAKGTGLQTGKGHGLQTGKGGGLQTGKAYSF